MTQLRKRENKREKRKVAEKQEKIRNLWKRLNEKE